MKKQLLFLVMLLLPLTASAYDIAVPNGDDITIYYNYTNNGLELEVTSYNVEASNCYTGNVVIPNEVTYMNRTRKVTRIGERAFFQCWDLTSVTIPNSVTSIGYSAFYGCDNLCVVIIPDIAAWCSIIFEDNFANPLHNRWARHLYSDENTEIKDLVIPNTVTSIGDWAFHYCSSLTSVIIPNSVTSIGKGTFYGCSGLTSIIIPNTVTSIGDYAFWDCIGLTSVTIGNGVTSIGDRAFMNCKGLQKVIVSDIASWCGIDFNNGGNPLNYAKHLYFDENTEIKDLVIPNSVTSISNWAFGDCTGLTSVTISNSVTSIGYCAFANCSGLTSVTIGNSVTNIEKFAFGGADIPTIISLIENPFAITGKTSDYKTFSLNTFNNATLYVPKGTINKYKATDGWQDFVFIEDGETPPSPEKCEKPTIGYSNGKLTFSSGTEGATCYYTITDDDIKAGSGSEVQLGVTYNISVYATKSGYDNSETATATLCWIDAAPQTEGVTDGMAQITAHPVLVKTDNGFITVEGADDRTNVSIYSTDGKQLGSAISKNNIATIATNIQPGSIAIVKVGEKAIKVIMK